MERRATVKIGIALCSTVLTVGSLGKLYWGGLRIGWARAEFTLVRRLAAERAKPLRVNPASAGPGRVHASRRRLD